MKRFTDTDIWDKSWFMALSCKQKCLVRFLFDKCDNCGIWEPNYRIAEIYIGEAVTEEEILAIDEGNQFEVLENGKIFASGFCEFQYGELTETCKPHLPIIKKLKKLGLYEYVSKGYPKGIDTLKEKEQEKDTDKEKEEEKEKEVRTKKEKAKIEIENEQKVTKAKYTILIDELKDKDQREIFSEVKKFIDEQKPTFLGPYLDAWNLFAMKNNLIDAPRRETQSRLNQIRIRTKEPGFKFFDILGAILKSNFLKGGNDRSWVVDIDFILESEKNYIKILEGGYK